MTTARRKVPPSPAQLAQREAAMAAGAERNRGVWQANRAPSFTPGPDGTAAKAQRNSTAVKNAKTAQARKVRKMIEVTEQEVNAHIRRKWPHIEGANLLLGMATDVIAQNLAVASMGKVPVYDAKDAKAQVDMCLAVIAFIGKMETPAGPIDVKAEMADVSEKLRRQLHAIPAPPKPPDPEVVAMAHRFLEMEEREGA